MSTISVKAFGGGVGPVVSGTGLVITSSGLQNPNPPVVTASTSPVIIPSIIASVFPTIASQDIVPAQYSGGEDNISSTSDILGNAPIVGPVAVDSSGVLAPVPDPNAVNSVNPVVSVNSAVVGINPLVVLGLGALGLGAIIMLKK